MTSEKRESKPVFSPAFPPPSVNREEEYIERMIRRDRLYETRDDTAPNFNHRSE